MRHSHDGANLGDVDSTAPPVVVAQQLVAHVEQVAGRLACAVDLGPRRELVARKEASPEARVAAPVAQQTQTSRVTVPFMRPTHRRRHSMCAQTRHRFIRTFYPRATYRARPEQKIHQHPDGVPMRWVKSQLEQAGFCGWRSITPRRGPCRRRQVFGRCNRSPGRATPPAPPRWRRRSGWRCSGRLPGSL